MRVPLSELAGIGGSNGITSGPGQDQPRPLYLYDVPALGEYNVEGIYAMGGTSTVAKVRKNGMSHALKVFPPGYHPSLYDREIIIHSNLTHAGFVEFRGAVTVPIMEGNEVQEARAILLEPAQEDMDRFLRRRGTMPPHQAVNIADQLASAVEELHDKGLAHGDIKLGNSLIIDNNASKVKLCDLGTAEVTPYKQATGQFAGSPATAAPEQWNGELVQATDTHALTILMFQLLTAQDFYVDEWQAREALIEPEGYDLLVADRVKQVPSELGNVFRAGWALDPNQRPAPRELTKRALKQLQKV